MARTARTHIGLPCVEKVGCCDALSLLIPCTPVKESVDDGRSASDVGEPVLSVPVRRSCSLHLRLSACESAFPPLLCDPKSGRGRSSRQLKMDRAGVPALHAATRSFVRTHHAHDIFSRCQRSRRTCVYCMLSHLSKLTEIGGWSNDTLRQVSPLQSARRLTMGGVVAPDRPLVMIVTFVPLFAGGESTVSNGDPCVHHLRSQRPAPC